MIICKVIGHVWATQKEKELEGLKLMIVKEITTDKSGGAKFVAADTVCAGVGDEVLVVEGSTARRAIGGDSVPMDAAIVGVVDSVEIKKEPSGDKK